MQIKALAAGSAGRNGDPCRGLYEGQNTYDVPNIFGQCLNLIIGTGIEGRFASFY